MARVNMDILGIREIKWTGMGKFNGDDNSIYYCGQESLKRNGATSIVNKRVQVCTPTSNAEEAEAERFYKDLQDHLELTPQKDVF